MVSSNNFQRSIPFDMAADPSSEKKRATPADPIDVSIIIVNWNTGGLLRDCVASVYAHTRDVSFEVIVVDNHSADSSVELMAADFPAVKLIRNAENLGYAKANNQGFRISRGDLILLLNPDTLIPDQAVDRLAADLRAAAPRVAAVGPRLLNRHGRFQREQGRRLPSLATAITQYFFLSHLLGLPGIFQNRDFKRALTVDWLCGACLLCRREAYARLNGLDETFFLYCEDLDFGFRLRKLGLQSRLQPDVSITHLSKQSTRQQGGEIYNYQIRNLIRFYSQHHSPLSSGLFTGIMAAGLGSRFLVFSLLARLQPSAAWAEKAEEMKRLRALLHA